jgi:hypothetical protein
MHHWQKMAGILLAMAILGGCATQVRNASVHKSVAEQSAQPMPRKLLLLPIDIRVHEISAGGVVEKVDAWTAAANANANRSMHEIGGQRKLFDLTETPALSASDKEVLDQHVALYELVANSADFSRSGPFQVWHERARDFDYTLGPGLKDLAGRSDMEAAVIVIGSDYISSAGRKATMALGVLAAAFTGIAVIPQGGTAFVSVGVVELRTGNLLWFSTNRSQGNDLREQAQVRSVLERLFDEYPGNPVTTAANASK